MFRVFNIFYINLNIWHRIKTIWQFEFIIPSWSYYFKFIAHALFSYILPCVINKFWRVKCLFELLKSNLCDKLRASLCSLYFCCFLRLWILLPCLYLDNDCSILFNFFLSYRFIAFYDKFNFMFQVLINIFRSIKTKTKSFGISYHNYIFFLLL